METETPTPIETKGDASLVTGAPQPVRRCAFPPCGAELNEAPPLCRRHNELGQFVQWAVLNILVNLKLLTITRTPEKAATSGLVDASGIPLPGDGND